MGGGTNPSGSRPFWLLKSSLPIQHDTLVALRMNHSTGWKKDRSLLIEILNDIVYQCNRAPIARANPPSWNGLPIFTR
jgi:hypothetical protein